jgi:3-methyladenine DNA glycosylase AlkC
MFRREPRRLIPLLERLKDDSELYVRRSVANNVADILKDNPEIGYRLLERWANNAPLSRLWLIRHASRFQRNLGEQRAIHLRGTS